MNCHWILTLLFNTLFLWRNGSPLWKATVDILVSFVPFEARFEGNKSNSLGILMIWIPRPETLWYIVDPDLRQIKCYSSFLIICNYFVVKLQWDMHPRSINQDSYLKSSVHQIAKLHFGIICTCGQKSLVDISQTCSLCSPPNGPVLGPENKSKDVKSQNYHMIDHFRW